MRLTAAQFRRFMMDPVWIALEKELKLVRKSVRNQAIMETGEDRLRVIDESRGQIQAIDRMLDWPQMNLDNLEVEKPESKEEPDQEENESEL